jgi:peptidoglycan/xylan/chitin deacetylase (PgdA/CDA1 family)
MQSYEQGLKTTSAPEQLQPTPVPTWLPPGKQAAVCFSVDDIHPGKGTDAYEAGGDLARGQLGHIGWLLTRHPNLRVTLFTTADWRATSPVPTRRLLARIPYLRDQLPLAKVLAAGTMRLSRHPEFVGYLKQLTRIEIGLHGLTHVGHGRSIPVEFQQQDTAACRRILQEVIEIFNEAELAYVRGMTPPGWHLSASLAQAMIEVGLEFVASARDVQTPISCTATTKMSGLQGVSLIYPELICNGRLLHITSNFQATSSIDRAIAIIEQGGLLAIKAHIVKNACGHIALDGLDELYRNYLDLLFTRLERDYGAALWWTSMGELSARCMNGRECGSVKHEVIGA